MASISLDVLDMIAECYKKYSEDKLTELRQALHAQTALVCSVFESSGRGGALLKVSEQQQRDLRLELQRMNAIVQLARLTSHEQYAAARGAPAVQERRAAAERAVFGCERFREEHAMDALRRLQDEMKVAGTIVTKQEREMIVRAMDDLKAGAWYKCPNGHLYCITECGGAMEESKCPDCGAKIGGQNHALTAGNTHAGEMDGSRFAAWSEGNNLANFDLQNLL